MPQVIEFPPLQPDPRAAVLAMVHVCRGLPEAGETFAEFRARLRDAKLWRPEAPMPTLRFLGAGGAHVARSPFMKRVAATKDDGPALDVVADRLWDLNPLLFKTVLDMCKERGRVRDEIYKHLTSAAYKGTVPSRPDMDAWLEIATALEVLRPLGITVTLSGRAPRFADRAAVFEVDEFLALDKPEPDPEIPRFDASAEAAPVAAPVDEPTQKSAAAPPPAAATTDGVLRWLVGGEALPSPRNREPAVPVPRFAGAEVFPEEVCDDTRRRLDAWWREVGRAPTGFAPEDFGVEAEAWFDRPDEVLYRIAVAAALVFRYDAERAAVLAAWKNLDDTGILRDLYQGTMPSALLGTLDARALMLASLVARRCAEYPELAATLDQQRSAADAFNVLEGALGRGLFRIELFWIMSMLARLGVLRHADVADYTALPHRLVRHTLFRLGFLASPYAADAAGLARASKAARRLAGAAEAADQVVAGFARAAGCAYDCPHRRTCDFACRERLD
ncbi:MAG TPA: hypothetical protein VKE22_17705 [Haliangiales bacterium]|nr:hypothetical protein [Haliangiales bacterium]